MNRSFRSRPVRASVLALVLTVTAIAQFGASAEVHFEALGYYRHGSAEIVAHDPTTQRLFVVNGAFKSLDVVDIKNLKQLQLYERVRVGSEEMEPTHVHVHNGIVAIALASNKQRPGHVLFLDVESNVLADVEVGFLPDMLTFTPDGQHVVVACEGEPSVDYQRDPEGCIAMIDLSAGVKNLTSANVTRMGFEKFYDRGKLPKGIRILRRGYIPQDLEPEYLTIGPHGKRAWAVLQENNALAMIDLTARRIDRLVPFGFKDHRQPKNGFDANDTDKKADVRPWPVFGMYQPDAIASFEHRGEVYLVTANEGDTRRNAVFNEVALVKDLKLDPEAFPNAEEIQSVEQLGNLQVTAATGDLDGDGDYDELYSFGARSFSIWSADGALVFDSGCEIEERTAKLLGNQFNSDQGADGSFDQRSDDRGPEPECVDVGEIDGRRFAFVGLERVGGIMAYDISDPRAPTYAGYINTLSVSGTAPDRVLTDSGPEGVRFISAANSPSGKALLAVAFEVSGTTRLYELTVP